MRLLIAGSHRGIFRDIWRKEFVVTRVAGVNTLVRFAATLVSGTIKQYTNSTGNGYLL